LMTSAALLWVTSNPILTPLTKHHNFALAVSHHIPTHYYYTFEGSVLKEGILSGRLRLCHLSLSLARTGALAKH